MDPRPPANASVREKRRHQTALEIEQIDVIKAMTAAEYSRRQFVLSMAASKNTKLLIPGQKADAVKAAEEWVAIWFNQSGQRNASSQLFKYTVDVRLWSTLVGDDVEFPFAFMREAAERFPRESVYETDVQSAKGGAAPLRLDTNLRRAETTPASTPATSPASGSPLSRFWKRQEPRASVSSPPVSPKGRVAEISRVAADAGPERKQSVSTASYEDPKAPKNVTHQRSHFFLRLGRSWTRRLSTF